MNLFPVVLLADPDDVAVLQPHIDAAVAFLNERADIVADLLATRGWTPEMIAWSSVFHALAVSVKNGDLRLDLLVPGT